MERRSFFRLAGLAALAATGGALTSCDAGIPLPSLSSTGGEVSVAGSPDVSFSSDVDVLVVGSGIAGLSAAMEPLDAQMSVMVAEKLGLLGGESYAAAGVMRVAGSSLQERAGIDLTVDQAWADRRQKMSDAGVPGLDRAETLFRAAPEWADRLADSYGAQFADPGSYAQPGVSEDVLLPKGGLGDMESVMTPLRDHLASKGVIYSTGRRATAFVLDGDGTVCGMRFTATDGGAVTDIHAGAVIMATGGFASNQSLVDAYLSSQAYAGCLTTASMGEGQLLCSIIDGQLGDMDAVPPLTGDVPPTAAWGLFGPTLIVDPSGQRFAREDDAAAAANACFADERGYWWTVFGAELSGGGQARSIAQTAGKHAKRMIGPYGDVATLADGMGVPADALGRTLSRYGDLVGAGKDDDFGRTAFLEELNPPYYAVKQFPVRYKTYGGVRTDADGRLTDAAGSPIAHAYGCGSVVAGDVDGLAANGTAGLLAGRAAVHDLGEG